MQSISSIDHLLKTWLTHVAKLVTLKQLKPRTLRAYSTIARKYFDTLGSRDARDISADDIEQWMLDVASAVLDNASRRDCVGYTTANRALVVLQLALKHAVRRRLIETNVARGVARLKEQPRTRYLSPAEVASIRDALVRVERHRVRKALPSQRGETRSPTQALLLLTLTGMRLSEALRLRVSEVSLQEGILKLPHTKCGYREVPLSDAAIDLLAEQLEFAEDGWVFPSVRGGPVRHVYSVWSTALDLSGIDKTDVVIHTLRHSLITDLLRHGADIKVAADIAGHSSLDVTRSIYGRPLATIDGRRAINDYAARIGASAAALRRMGGAA